MQFLKARGRSAERRNAERVERPEYRTGLTLTLILTLTLTSTNPINPYPKPKPKLYHNPKACSAFGFCVSFVRFFYNK